MFMRRGAQKVQYFILISPIKQNMKDRRKEAKITHDILSNLFNIYDGKKLGLFILKLF